MDGLFFDSALEPEGFKYDFEKDITNFRKETTDKLFIDTSYNDISEYFTARERFKEMNSKIQISEIEKGVSNKYYIKIRLSGNDDEI